MDQMDYGLDEPKLVLQQDGGVFVAGQVQAPMEPPAVPRAMRWDAGTKLFMSLVGDQGLMVGSALLETVAPATFQLGYITINQGVERFLIDQHQVDGSDDPINHPNRVWKSFAWKTKVPKIEGRPTKLRFYVRSSGKIDKVVKFKYYISLGYPFNRSET